MQKQIDQVTFDHVQPYIEIDIAYIEKQTAEALQAFRTYLAHPSEDTTGLRLDTLILQAAGLKQSYALIESCLKRLQGDE